MEPITTEKLFELYKDTLDKCGSYLLKENDDVIKYNVFEEFDIGIHSFFHSDNLRTLYLKGFISEDKLLKSNLLRDKVIILQNSQEWNMHSLKTSKNWRDVFALCDDIKALT